MSHVPHELVAEFPQLAGKLGQLKRGNAHFARLAHTYAELNRQVFRAECRLAPMDPLAEAQLRRRRAAVKDELYGLLSA